MNRKANPWRISFSLAMAIMVMGQTAWAQSQLERLEQQIRQRNASPTAEPSAARAQSPAPVIMSAAVAGASAHEPAYLAMAVDDQRDRGRGVRIVTVHPGGPADRAGLRSQDLITAVTGIRVRQMADLSDILDTFSPGQTAAFEIVRGEQKQTLKVTFGRRPTETKARGGTPPPPMPQLGTRQPSPQPTQPPPAASKDQPESIPSPSEAIPAPPEQPAGPMLEPPKKAEPPQDTSQRVDQLQRRIEALERRVAELEQALAKTAK